MKGRELDKGKYTYSVDQRDEFVPYSCTNRRTVMSQTNTGLSKTENSY